MFPVWNFSIILWCIGSDWEIFFSKTFWNFTVLSLEFDEIWFFIWYPKVIFHSHPVHDDFVCGNYIWFIRFFWAFGFQSLNWSQHDSLSVQTIIYCQRWHCFIVFIITQTCKFQIPEQLQRQVSASLGWVSSFLFLLFSPCSDMAE